MAEKGSESKEAGNKPIKDFVETFPIGYAYAFLVFCGALYFHFYYNAFHVPVFRYMDIAEIAVSFLPIIIVIIVFSGVCFCGFSLLNLIIGIFKSTKRISKIQLFIRRACKNSIVQNSLILIICGLCALYLFVANKRLEKAMDDISFDNYRHVYWRVFLVGAAIVLLFLSFRNKLIVIITVFVMAVVFESMSDVKECIEDAKKRNKSYTIITADNDTIITDKNHYFIGKTNGYVFLFNSSTKAYDDIPMGRIRHMYFEYKNR